jgi:hypothetical protein
VTPILTLPLQQKCTFGTRCRFCLPLETRKDVGAVSLCRLERMSTVLRQIVHFKATSQGKSRDEILCRLVFRRKAFAPPIPGPYSVCSPASSHLSGVCRLVFRGRYSVSSPACLGSLLQLFVAVSLGHLATCQLTPHRKKRAVKTTWYQAHSTVDHRFTFSPSPWVPS